VDDKLAEMKVWSSLLTMATIFFRNVWGCSVEPKIATMPHMIWRGEQRVLGERETIVFREIEVTDLFWGGSRKFYSGPFIEGEFFHLPPS